MYDEKEKFLHIGDTVVSIYDIANAVGISASAVSVVLNGRADKMRISREKQKKILEVAKEMGYIPNVTARKLTSKNVPHMPEIALCWSPSQHSMFLNTFINVLQNMTSSGEVKEMRYTILPYKNRELEKLEPILSANHYNGIIVPPVSSEDIAFLSKTNIKVPAVMLYGDIPQYHLVSVNNSKVGADIAAIFCKHGHQSVGVMCPADKHPISTIAQRISSFIDNCRIQKMDVKVFDIGEGMPPQNRIEEGKQAAQKMIAEHVIPTALFIQNDLLALGALNVFSQYGIRIPEDMEIIVYGINDVLEIHRPSITTVCYPTEEVSRACITIMSNSLDMMGSAPIRKMIDTPFVFRESCQP